MNTADIKKRKKCFVIPGCFVPTNSTVTLLTYKRLRSLDLDFDVLAYKGKDDDGIRAELNLDPNWKKFSIKYFSNYTSLSIRHPLSIIKNIFKMRKYVKLSLKEFEKNKYDYLYTSSVPGISHTCGYKIKMKHPDVKWIASFSDPIKNSPYKKDPDLKYRNILYRILFKIEVLLFMNEGFESVAIENADQLVFICNEQRDFTLSQYPNKEELLKKSIVQELTYIPEWKMYKELIEAKPVNNTPKIGVHLGNIYGYRKVDTFLEALKELKKEDKDLSNKIVFHQYSKVKTHINKFIMDNQLQDVFIVHDKVPYNESLNVMKNADILVLFDTIIDEGIQPYLPSKIVEYQLLKKPILAICKDNSPSYRILEGHYCGYCVSDIIKNIKQLIG